MNVTKQLSNWIINVNIYLKNKYFTKGNKNITQDDKDDLIKYNVLILENFPDLKGNTKLYGIINDLNTSKT
ncbi:21670_t:CDS:1, partial [Cetraspora pellucida]